jgi:hypothetical protein
VHLYPHRSGRYPGRKCMLGAVLPRARYSGMLQAAALFSLEGAFVKTSIWFLVFSFVFGSGFLLGNTCHSRCSLMGRCLVTSLLEAGMTRSTRFSPRLEQGSMFPVPCSWTWSRLW